MSFNNTENIIQNYCVTFTQSGCRSIDNNFIIKAADVTMEKAQKIAEILFPQYSGIQIKAIENDRNTLTPSEYDFLRGKIKEERQRIMRNQEHRIKEGLQEGPLKEDEYTEYLLKLIRKMDARMDQFSTYHS